MRFDFGGSPATVLAAPMIALALGFTAPCTGISALEKYSVKELGETAPDVLSKEVREVLGQTGYRVVNSADKTICDLWLRIEVPVIEKFEEQLDVKYPVQPGSLLAVIRFPANYSDYRKQKIKAGTYTLRYGHQPQDGNHLGTAQYRDFVIASPAADDKSPAPVGQETLEEMSTKVTNTTHPAILSLLPPLKGRGKLPAMAHDDTLNLEVLVVTTSTAKGSSTKELQLELVTVGHAPE